MKMLSLAIAVQDICSLFDANAQVCSGIVVKWHSCVRRKLILPLWCIVLVQWALIWTHLKQGELTVQNMLDVKLMAEIYRIRTHAFVAESPPSGSRRGFRRPVQHLLRQLQQRQGAETPSQLQAQQPPVRLPALPPPV